MYSSFSSDGLKYLNIDDVFERVLMDMKVNTNFDQLTEPQYQTLISSPDSKFNRASKITDVKKENYLNSKLGLIIDKTGANAYKIGQYVQQLQNIGYQCFCIYISSDLQESILRNMNRTQRRLRQQDVVST